MNSKISPEAFKLFFELSNDLLSVSDFNGYFIQVNQKWLETSGYTFEELTQYPFLEFVHPEDKEKTQKEAQDLFSGKPEAIKFENRYLGKNGNVIWLEWNSVIDRERNLTYSVARDITDKKKILQEKEQLSQVVNQVSEGVVITDHQEKVKWVNQAFCDRSGYSLEEVKGKSLGYLLQGEQTSLQDVKRVKKGIESKKPFTQEILNFRKDGSTFWNELSITPIFDEEGRLTQYYGIQKDVTDRVEAEIALEEYGANLKALHVISTELDLDLAQLFDKYLEVGCKMFKLPLGLVCKIDS
ncbi:MAG: PAS domain S-box protein, partial [Bacteroidota bacterium]